MKFQVKILAAVLVCALAIVFVVKGKNFSSADATNGAVTLEWEAGPGVFTGYKIYYGTESGKYFQAKGQGMDVGRTASMARPNAKIKNLTPGKKYFFAVTVYDANGKESDYSDEVSKIVPQEK